MLASRSADNIIFLLCVYLKFGAAAADDAFEIGYLLFGYYTSKTEIYRVGSITVNPFDNCIIVTNKAEVVCPSSRGRAC